MKVVRRAELLRVDLTDVESSLLAGLLDDFAAMLAVPDLADPVYQRLFPDGYSDDDAASAEYRELVEVDLRADRNGRLQSCRAELPDGAGRVSLDGEAADRWLRVLNDLRLSLGHPAGHHRGLRTRPRRAGGGDLSLAQRGAGTAGREADGLSPRPGPNRPEPRPDIVGTVLRLPIEIRDGILAHARRDHPDEACGVVAGPAGSDRPVRLIEMAQRRAAHRPSTGSTPSEQLGSGKRWTTPTRSR